MADFYSTTPTGAYSTSQIPPTNISLDNIRRTFDLKDIVAELRPADTPWFTYLTKVRRQNTSDPIFKMLEQRHQWQRRNFHVATALAAGQDITAHATGIVVKCYYDSRGKLGTAEQDPTFFVAGQVVAIENVTESDNGVTGTLYARVVSHGSTATRLQVNPLYILSSTAKTDVSGKSTTFSIPDNSRGQVVGTAYAEGSGAPAGWSDILGATEGYAQIFKTACPLFSGTAMATEYRGRKNEFMRVWDEKMREHKMDVEHAMMFGVGHVANTTGVPTAEVSTESAKRYTWGILPFVSLYGTSAAFSYASSGYNDFVDFCQDFFAPENGNSGSKLVLASRKVVGWFNKLNQGSFFGNSVNNNWMDVQNVKSKFGFNLSRITNPFGEMNFVSHPLLRGQWEDYAIVIDLPNIAYRPLVGNGISRDTFYQTNVQDNDVDGRIDQIITESGLQVMLPETHAVLKWS